MSDTETVQHVCSILATYLRTPEAVVSLVTEDDPYDEAPRVAEACGLVADALDLLAREHDTDGQDYAQLFEMLEPDQARQVAAVAVAFMVSTAASFVVSDADDEPTGPNLLS